MTLDNQTDLFDNYYGNIFASRWTKLKKSLLEPTRHIARENRFADTNEVKKALIQAKATPFPYYSGCWQGDYFDASLKDNNGLNLFYIMDPASLLPVHTLNPSFDSKILDICAAPGGKTLVLFEKVFAKGFLVSNDFSRNRVSRLKTVIRDYIPDNFFSSLKVTSHDASKWCLYEKNIYDFVLADVPCSSERHVLNKPDEFKKWSPSRSKMLAKRQYAILASVYQVVKTGGVFVYSTCSLSPGENDGVVEKLLKKKKDLVRVLNFDAPPFGEKTAFGWMCLPDQTGWGPLYFSLLKKYG